MSKGMIKQFHKASQFMSEKMGAESEKTTMDEEFKEMERKIDVTSKAVQEIMTYCKEYLQPNPATRAKLNMMTKLQGKQKDIKYPQTEGTLGEVMCKFGQELGHDSDFGNSMVEVGESFRSLSEIKNSLDISVKQNFLDPLQQLHDKDLKEVMHHRRKLEGRRLDYDYKRNKGNKVPPDELSQAEEKLQESLDVADNSMFNLLSGDIEQVSQLATLVESMLEFHRQSADILESLKENLDSKIEEINRAPQKERSRKQLRTRSNASSGGEYQKNSSPPMASPRHTQAPPQPVKTQNKPEQPCCKALYDFEPQNEGELQFNEGDIITITCRIDENWFEGSLGSQIGFFPCNYVEVIKPL